jgi:hypothetical protein
MEAVREGGREGKGKKGPSFCPLLIEIRNFGMGKCAVQDLSEWLEIVK